MKRIICIIIIFVLTLCPIMVFANGAPLVWDPEKLGYLTFDENSGITLLEESVTFDFTKENIGFFKEDKVEVNYKLKNLTNKEKNLKMMFITPMQGSGFNATINGQRIEGIMQHNTVNLPANWQASKIGEAIEPMSGKVLQSFMKHEYADSGEVSGIIIPLKIKPNEVLELNMLYNYNSGFYRMANVVQTVYDNIYYLTPAKFWEGEPKVNLRIKFSMDSNYKVASNIPLNKISNNDYEAILSSIPNEEWQFSFVDKSILIFGTNKKSTHNTLTLIIAILITLIVYILQVRSGKNFIGLIGYLLVFLFVKILIPALWAYPLGPILSIFFYLIVITVLCLIYRKGTKTNMKKKEIQNTNRKEL